MGMLKAGVTFGDWEGTASADNLDKNDISDLLEQRRLLDRKSELVVAIELYTAENHPGQPVRPPTVRAYIATGEGYDNIADWIRRTPDPLPLRQIEVELTHEQFVGLFKRFSVLLTRRGLNLSGREAADT
jgi:hypothetical protein